MPEGNVSGASLSLHTWPTSSGSNALVSSMWMTASNCSAKRVKLVALAFCVGPVDHADGTLQPL